MKKHLLPKKIRNTIVTHIPEYWLKSSTFRKTYRFLEKSEFWSSEQIKEYQLKKLKEIISHAYNTVPYYKREWDKIGFKPEDIKVLEDIKKIPLLNKETVQKYEDEFISNLYKKENLQLIFSGGSTGVPATYFDERDINGIERAFIYSQWKRVGYDVHKVNRVAMLRGLRPSHGIYEIRGNNLIMSSYFDQHTDLQEYIDIIQKFNPDFLHVYPSSIFILAQFILENNIKINLSKLKAILSASENLYNYQKEIIQRAFGVRVFDFYGHSEGACLAGECEISSLYHIFPQYGYAEVLDTQGNEVLGQDGKGELVATSFIRKAMPLIRFNTEDIIITTAERCSCGRNFMVFKDVEGRTQDYLVTKKGRLIPGNVLLPYEVLNIFDNTLKYQFYQDKRGYCKFIVVKKPGYTSLDEENILRELRKELTDDMQIEIEYVDEIPRTSSGKHMFLRTKLKPWLEQFKEEG
ncbi:MAG TPA: phenylacetate--CoA ligase family protein [Candidatus Cloacimonadota bacterium]|nr:phenylacetate--CoA ligase family protein [Candidatus Cloacimonadota bacterium]HQL14422.1 phenylacetate--CoA ligase family protein [Candidatus Cloacimonadota bacterium]